MAAAFFNLYADRECRGISAGTSPADHIHPEVLAVMREFGIDLSQARPHKLTPVLAGNVAVLVTMGCGEACPFVPGLKVIDWAIPDPKGQPAEKVRQIRDEIHEKIRALLRGDCAECCSGLTNPTAVNRDLLPT